MSGMLRSKQPQASEIYLHAAVLERYLHELAE
jgi:hypothetical protein